MSEVSEKAARKGKLLEAIEKNPDDVVLRSEIIFGGVSTGEGQYGIHCGAYPSAVIKMVCFDLNLRATMLFQQIEFQRAMAAQKESEKDKRIINPSCGTGIGAN